jgi:lipopolysaccharide export system permease protein
MSLASTVVAVFSVRVAGFACSVLAINFPFAVFVQYLILALAAAFGLSAIGRGVIIEPPAFINNAVAALTARLAQRGMRAAT